MAGVASAPVALPPDASAPSEPTPAAGEPPLLQGLELPDSGAASLADAHALDFPGALSLKRNGPRPPVFAGVGDEAILAADSVNTQAAGPKGPPAKVSLFGGPPVVGHSFVFVIDRSNSMGEGGLGVIAAAEAELQAALGGLLPEHRFQLIAYNQKPAYFSPTGLVEANEANRRAVRSFFASLGAFGSTEHETALLAALRQKPDVVFLFTDGGDPHLNTAQLERIASRAGSATSIHCLQFGRGELQEKDNFLMRLASRTRGTFGYIDMNQPRRAK